MEIGPFTFVKGSEMAAVAGISLDKSLNGAAVNGALAFSLKEGPRKSRVRSPEDGWEVELRAGSEFVVARTTKQLADDALIDEAIGMTLRSLDLTSVEDFNHLVTVAPLDEYILLRKRDARTLVRYCSLVDFPVSMDVRFEILLADGTRGVPAEQELKWMPAFRFYRLSQSTLDLFDAFRNLYLSLEALLDHFWPKTSSERESKWLDRALAEAGKKVNFGLFAKPGSGNPVKEVSGRIYDVRRHLFHAKTGRTLIPDEAVSYSKVAGAYRTLFSLWTEFVRRWIATRSTGGTLTYHGFKVAVENMTASTYLAITEDDTVAGPDDLVSPKGMPVTRFPGAAVKVFESAPGKMALTYKTDVLALPIRNLGRIVMCGPKDELLIVNSIKGCMNLADVDQFEFVNVGRLMNKVQPRVGI